MSLEVRARGASTAEALIGRILSASIDEPISGLKSFSVELPFSELQSAGYGEGGLVLAAGREIGILREGDGELFRGICENQSIEMKDGAEIVTLSGQGLALELSFVNTHRGFEVLNRTMQQALDDILSGTGWTGVATGSFNNVTKRFDNMSKLAAITELASIGAAYWRETTTVRQIEIKNTSAASGILATNTQTLSPDVLEENPDLAPIQSVGKITEDTTELYNRIVPYGKTDGDEVFDLFASNRNSPYTIQSVAIARPRIVEEMGVGESALGGSSFPTDGFSGGIEITIWCEGTDRLILCLFSCASTSGAGLPVEIRANGKVFEGFLGGNIVGQGRQILCTMLRAPEIGENKLSAIYDASGPPADARWKFISLEHVQQNGSIGGPDGVTGGINNANGNSTTPSVVVGGTVPLGLVIDRLIHATATATPGAGQTELSNTTVNGFGTSNTGRSSVENGNPSGGDVTMSWTLSAAVQWLIAGLEIRPAKAYYIEDATSVAAYGLREQNLPLGSFKPLTPDDRIAAANSMYDAAVSYMNDHKDPMLNLDSLVPAFMRHTNWLPGDSLKVELVGQTAPAGTLDVRGDYVVTTRSHSYDENGARNWNLKVSNTKRFARDLIELVGSLREQLEAVQQNQV